MKGPGVKGLAAVAALGAGLAAGCAGLGAMAQNGDPMARGEAVYTHWCAPCHAPGPGHPGTQSLQVKYGGEISPVLVERTDLSPEAVAVFVRTGVLSMPPFRKTEVTDAELEVLAAYVARNYEAP